MIVTKLFTDPDYVFADKLAAFEEWGDADGDGRVRYVVSCCVNFPIHLLFVVVGKSL